VAADANAGLLATPETRPLPTRRALETHSIQDAYLRRTEP